ncbi:MAG: phenylalanine--tRNA ligase subunit beta [Flavobacteriaceae bacterium]|nr:phenylalanine--tRNA ligase subunit beta [Flavobacteriaceae bacterium]|tara:strand:- start:27225 stop:29624 length:2400 start_codon:yes stop_codon:yes gene_type:complete
MKISYNWINQFLKTNIPHLKISEMLTSIGLEVEGIEKFSSVRGGLKDVVVGEVISCENHPNADRLKVTQVNLGDEIAQIVCGAPNVAKNQKVAVATVGSTLYDQKGNEFKIKKTVIRGEESNGMICAEDELGIGDSHEGIMVLDEKIKSGTPCSKVFNIEEDYIFNIGLTPNRADAMSHMGVARDLKALLSFNKISFEWACPEVTKFKFDKSNKSMPVDIQEPKLVDAYHGITITNVSIKKSPSWLQNRLKSINITPKNNIVDITNYILHELGQPLHAFDANRINEGIIVKKFKGHKKFQTLDGIERKLDENDLMICDHKKPLCIAGIIGGEQSAVGDKTKDIFLESACFNSISVRKSAKKFGLNTDASFRFERGVDPEIGIYAIKRAAILIQELAGGTIGQIYSFQKEKKKKEIILKFDYIDKLIGQKIEKNEIIKILSSLDMIVSKNDKDSLKVIIPRYRIDVYRPADLVEEILRIYGYNNIKIPEKFINNSYDYESKIIYNFNENVSQVLVNHGFNETINNSISSPKNNALTDKLKPVKIINPMGIELSQLRNSLIPSCLEVVKYNSNRQSKNIKIFEFGKIYESNKTNFKESKLLSIALTDNVYEENWNIKEQPDIFFYYKGVVEIILSSKIKKWEEKFIKNKTFQEGLEYIINDEKIFEFGYLNKSLLDSYSIKQNIVYGQLYLDIVSKYLIHEIYHENIPKFPIVKRDFSLLLNQNVVFKDIESLARSTEKNILKEVKLFDVYIGKKLPDDKKSYGVSFYFQDKNKTLTDHYVDKIMEKIRIKLSNEIGAEIR